MIDSKELCVSVIENQILIYKTKGELTDRQTQITTEMLFRKGFLACPHYPR